MNYDQLRDSLMPYLQAIQNIPGNTAKEKLSWIGKSASKLDVIENVGHLQPEMLLLLLVEAAVKHKRHEDITMALKSDDWTIVKRALKATWFFDGSQEIINVAYFSEHVFPDISHHTRTRIVCILARCVRNSSFAQEIFNVLKITYNPQIALPLLIICDKEFIFETVVEKKFILPVKIFQKIYYKNPELGVRLIKEYIGHYEKYRFCTRQRIWNKKITSPRTIIQEYKRILHTLAKKRPLEFIDIVQNVIKNVRYISTIGILSKTCAVKFLKKAKNAVIKYSYIYMLILPSTVVSAELLEMMFPSLMRYHCRESFSTDKMLNYLTNFPEDKKFQMFSKTYKNLYHHELLDKWENVTPALLKILPIEKRIECAEKLKCNSFVDSSYPTCTQIYETDWTCYLSVHEAIPLFKRGLRRSATPQSRLDFILKMIYTCKVNKDEDELSNVLSSIINEEYIINDSVEASKASKIINKIFQICEVSFLNIRNGALLCQIIRSFYIKYKYVDKDMIIHMLHFRFIKDLPIYDIMDMLTYDFVVRTNMFDDPQCLRQFLIYALEYQVSTNFKRPIHRDLGTKFTYLENVLSPIIIAIYNFNERWCKNNKHTEIKPIRITNYSVLIDNVYNPLFDFVNSKLLKCAKKLIRRNEPDLYRSWCMPHVSKNIADVTTRTALGLLKNNYQSILNNWEEYFTNCKEYYLDKRVQFFVRATRWYKDIPIKFSGRCLEYLREKDKREMPSALVFLGLLLHGNILAAMLRVRPLKEKIDSIINVNNIGLSRVLSVMISNPPVPLKLVSEVLENCAGIESTALSHIIPRFSEPNIMLFTKDISTMSVKRKICLIDLICLIAPAKEQINFLCKMWQTERDLLVKRALFKAIFMLFRDHPCSKTALLLQQTRILKFNDKSDIITLQMFLFHENYDMSKAMQDHTLPYFLYNDVIRRYVIHIILPYTLVSLQNKHIRCSDTIRYMVYLFLEKFLVNYKLSGRLDYGAIIEDLQNVFANKSLKQQYPQSFLLIEYARMMYISEKTHIRYISEETRLVIETVLNVSSSKQPENSDKLYFGYALGRRMHYLVERLFSRNETVLVDSMAEVLVRFLKQFYEGDSYFRVISYIVTGLLISANKHSRNMATMILTEEHWKEYDNFITNFGVSLASDPFADFFVERFV